MPVYIVKEGLKDRYWNDHLNKMFTRVEGYPLDCYDYQYTMVPIIAKMMIFELIFVSAFSFPQLPHVDFGRLGVAAAGCTQQFGID